MGGFRPVPFAAKKGKSLGLRRLVKSAEGQPCKQGQTTKTGCIPKEKKPGKKKPSPKEGGKVSASIRYQKGDMVTVPSGETVSVVDTTTTVDESGQTNVTHLWVKMPDGKVYQLPANTVRPIKDESGRERKPTPFEQIRQSPSGNAGFVDLIKAQGTADNLRDIIDRYYPDKSSEMGITVTPRGDVYATEIARQAMKTLVCKDIANRLADVPPEDLNVFWRDVGSQVPGMTKIERMIAPESDKKFFAAAAVVAQWADTSRDSNAFAIAIQYRAEALFGLKNTYRGEKSNSQREAVAGENGRSIANKHGKVIDAVLKAVYAATQDLLKSAGIEEMVLYRGMVVTPTDAEYILDKADYEGKVNPNAQLRLQPLSSFTHHWGTAVNFAEGEADQAVPIIMTMRVPRAHVFSTFLSGSGCLNEAEIVVLGGDHGGAVMAGKSGGSVPSEQELYDRLSVSKFVGK